MKPLDVRSLIILVFVISWIGVLPPLLTSYGYELPGWLNSLELLMTLGPLLGAIIYVYLKNGRKGLASFFGRLLRFKTSPYVLFIALVLPFIVVYVSAKLGLWFTETPWPEEFTFSSIISTGLMMFGIYLVVNTEELVWRGLVFDSLFDKYGFVKACLYLIPIWWLFHLPLFCFSGGHPAGVGIPEFSVLVVAMTLLLGWIYVKSNRSLFYVHIHHQLLNGFGQAFPLFPFFIDGNKGPNWVMVVLFLLIALFLARTSSKSLDSNRAKT